MPKGVNRQRPVWETQETILQPHIPPPRGSTAWLVTWQGRKGQGRVWVAHPVRKVRGFKPHDQPEESSPWRQGFCFPSFAHYQALGSLHPGDLPYLAYRGYSTHVSLTAYHKRTVPGPFLGKSRALYKGKFKNKMLLHVGTGNSWKVSLSTVAQVWCSGFKFGFYIQIHYLSLHGGKNNKAVQIYDTDVNLGRDREGDGRGSHTLPLGESPAGRTLCLLLSSKV